MTERTETMAPFSQETASRIPICPNPVFVIGSPRSGTSILAWALAHHPEFWASGELHILFGLFGQGWVKKKFQQEKNLPEGWFEEEKVEFDEFLGYLGLGLNALFSSRSRGKRWVDQTPLHASMAVELSKMFPGASFLHILRDGRDVVESMVNFQNAIPTEQQPVLRANDLYPPWATDFKEACLTWRSSVEAAMAFSKAEPARCLTIRYSDLVTDTQGTFRKIFEFLKVPDEGASAEYLSTTRLHSSHPSGTPPPAGQVSRQAWKNWAAERKMLFLQLGSHTLRKFGLATESDMEPWRSEVFDYLVPHVRKAAADVIPAGTATAVISNGIERFVELDGRAAWHFPIGKDGLYIGTIPGSDAEALAHLDEHRSRGAEFLIIPNTGFWWLEYYGELGRHLNESCTRVFADDRCIIYRIGPARPPAHA
jgi:hypothetical protein